MTCRVAFGIAPCLAFAATLWSQPIAPRTFTYKKVGALEIQADVYPAASGPGPRPVLVYFHGGSLINGRREGVDNWPQLKPLQAAGVTVVSVDYRLAPETKLPGIIEDLEDAFHWVRAQGPSLFNADSNRVGVAGGSAGGYLALAAGHRITPRLRVILAEMSYGDLIGPWQTNPSKHPPHYETNLTREEAWHQVSGPPIASASARKGNGGAFNDFIRRQAEWPKAISGWDPKTEAEKFRPYLPVRNVTRDYPPTFLLHGEQDTDVPFEQPKMMAAEFVRHGVEHRLVGLAGSEHGHRGAQPADLETARQESVAFVLKHLTAP